VTEALGHRAVRVATFAGTLCASMHVNAGVEDFRVTRWGSGTGAADEWTYALVVSTNE
jgi:hypothetical protein